MKTLSGINKRINVNEGYPNLILSTLFDLFMYIDGADDTLCDVAGSWQDTLNDEEAYHDLEYWIEVLGKKNKRPDLVRKMKKRKQNKRRDITLKIKDSLADIFNLMQTNEQKSQVEYRIICDSKSER